MRRVGGDAVDAPERFLTRLDKGQGRGLVADVTGHAGDPLGSPLVLEPSQRRLLQVAEHHFGPRLQGLPGDCGADAASSAGHDDDRIGQIACRCRHGELLGLWKALEPQCVSGLSDGRCPA